MHTSVHACLAPQVFGSWQPMDCSQQAPLEWDLIPQAGVLGRGGDPRALSFSHVRP